jgi:hypothetical protein
MHVGRIAAWFLLVIVSVGVADAATIKEVAACRAIAQRSKMVACFKALKRKPAKTEEAAPTDAEGAAPTKKDETGPAKTEGATPTNAEGAASSKRDERAPATRETAPPNVVPPSSSDELITTSRSILRRLPPTDRCVWIAMPSPGCLSPVSLLRIQHWRPRLAARHCLQTPSCRLWSAIPVFFPSCG